MVEFITAFWAGLFLFAAILNSISVINNILVTATGKGEAEMPMTVALLAAMFWAAFYIATRMQLA